MTAGAPGIGFEGGGVAPGARQVVPQRWDALSRVHTACMNGLTQSNHSHHATRHKSACHQDLHHRPASFVGGPSVEWISSFFAHLERSGTSVPDPGVENPESRIQTKRKDTRADESGGRHRSRLPACLVRLSIVRTACGLPTIDSRSRQGCPQAVATLLWNSEIR